MVSKRSKPKENLEENVKVPVAQEMGEPQEQEPVEKKKNTLLIGFLAILAVILIVLALNANNLFGNLGGKAGTEAPKCQVISTIKINPEKIAISLVDKPLELSTLAYDAQGSPIWQKVSYEWGISSSNTVGTLRQNNDLVTFTPLNKGTGDLFVKATNSCTQTPVIGSVPVVVEPTLTPPVSP
jgi:hypothetical protein